MKEIKEQRQGNDLGRTLGMFVAGAAAGSIVALLFAPASGRVTRRRIGMKLRAVQRDAARQFGQVQRRLARKAETLREAASEKLSDAREWVAGHVANGHHRRTAHHHV